MDGRATVVVVIGGGPLSDHAREMAERATDTVAVIAADSGLDVAVAAGLRPTALVGDLDSLSAAGRMWAYAHEIPIDEHPTDKDLTDTELALVGAAIHAVGGPTDLLLLGGTGDDLDRLDHLLGTLQALGRASLSIFDSITAVLGAAELRVVHDGRTAALDLEAGRTFSLLALHGPCSGIHLSGARWPLDDATLTGGEARGLSNVSDGNTSVRVTEGILTVVIP